VNVWIVAGLLGFFLGMRHATDPDHVVAVSTIVARTRRLGVSWLLGALWGLGHTLTIFAVGVLIIALKVAIPPRIGLGMEFAVGVVLVTLGALNVAGVRTWPFFQNAGHSHEHSHDEDDPGHSHHSPFGSEPGGPHVHEHPHTSSLDWLSRTVTMAGPAQLARAFAVGLVHGLAGSAAVALMVLATIPTMWGGIVYLLVFGAGTLAGMLLISAMMEASFLWISKRFHVDTLIRSGTGLVSILFGLYVMYQTGFVDGLFLSKVHWEPH
jgi:high-affinity nickel-transport protein